VIELTPEQQQAVEQGEPVRVVDPSMQGAYVLVREEVYERLAGTSCRPAEEPPAGIEPQMLDSMQAFWRDLPGLLRLRSRQRRYVAYHGHERVGYGRTQTELYRECLARGLRRGEFYVGPLEEREAPPWGSTPLERSLYECDDVPPSSALPPA
jgi:hypothetical protein